MSSEARRRIDRLAQGRHGLVTRADLLEAEWSPAAIHRACEDAWIVRMHAGVFRLAGTPTTYEQRLLAAVLAAGPSAVASHRAACALWELEIPPTAGLGHDPPIELSVVTARHPHVAGALIHRSLDLTPMQASHRSQIPVTNPLRTWVDLGAVASEQWVEKVLDQLVARRTITIQAARAALARVCRRGRRGCGHAHRVLDRRALADQRHDSHLETLFAELCRARGVPKPVFQHALRIGGRPARIDFAYLDELIAIEVDGWEAHGDRRSFSLDRARADDLAADGWVVLRFSWDHVLWRADWVAGTIERTITSRRRQLQPRPPPGEL